MKSKISKTIAAALAATLVTGTMVLPSYAEDTIGTSADSSSTIGESSGTKYEIVISHTETHEFISPTTYSGVQPIVIPELGKTGWFRWSRKPGETPYSGYWVDDVMVAETREEFDAWVASRLRTSSITTEDASDSTIGSSSDDRLIIAGPITTHISMPAISGVLVYTDGSMLINGQHVKTIDDVLMLEVDGVFVPAEKIGDRYYPITDEISSDDDNVTSNNTDDLFDNTDDATENNDIILSDNENIDTDSESVDESITDTTPGFGIEDFDYSYISDDSYFGAAFDAAFDAALDIFNALNMNKTEIVTDIVTYDMPCVVEDVYMIEDEYGYICHFVSLTINGTLYEIELSEELWSFFEEGYDLTLEIREGYNENGEYITEYYCNGEKVSIYVINDNNEWVLITTIE